jgi:hypothetical protein
MRAAYEAEATARQEIQAGYDEVQAAYQAEARAREAVEAELNTVSERLRGAIVNTRSSRLWRVFERLIPRGADDPAIPDSVGARLELLLSLHASFRYSVVAALRAILRKG